MAGLSIPKNLVSNALFNKPLFGDKTLKPLSEAVHNLMQSVAANGIRPLDVAMQIAGKIVQGRDGNPQLKSYVSENVISVLKEFVKVFNLSVDVARMVARIEASLVTTGANRINIPATTPATTPATASGTLYYSRLQQGPGSVSLYSPNPPRATPTALSLATRQLPPDPPINDYATLTSARDTRRPSLPGSHYDNLDGSQQVYSPRTGPAIGGSPSDYEDYEIPGLGLRATPKGGEPVYEVPRDPIIRPAIGGSQGPTNPSDGIYENAPKVPPFQ